MLRYYPPAAQHKLGSPWIGPNQVVCQATGHTVGIQRDQQKPIVFVHVDDLKLCPAPDEAKWNPDVSTAKSLCTSTVAFRPGSLSVMLHEHRLSMCPGGRTWPVTIRVKQCW